MACRKGARPVFKLNRLTAEQRHVLAQMWAEGARLVDIAQRMTELTGRKVGSSAVANFCRARLEAEAERAARLQRQADVIAKALVSTNSVEMSAKMRAALHATFFNLLNDSSDQNLAGVARELRELEKVDVAKEHLVVQQQKVKLSEKQLELKNKELEARLAAARQAVAQAEKAAEPAPGGASGAGKVVLPSDMLTKLKEAYGIA